MSLRHGLMGLLNYSENTGYELKKIFDDSLRYFWQVHKSQLYKELTAMEKDKLLSVSLVVQKDRPNKKIYSLTDKGREEFHHWLNANLDSSDFTVKETFLMKVFFWGELSIDEAVRKLNDFIEIHRKKLESYHSVPGHIDEYGNKVDRKKALFWEFTVRHGVAYSRMCMEWATEAIAMLEEKGN